MEQEPIRTAVWRREIGSLRSRLSGKPAIPQGLIRLLEALEREEPAAIALALTFGEPASVIGSLDEVSTQLGIEFAAELREQFEGMNQFEEAAAIDLLGDRLKDELAGRRC